MKTWICFLAALLVASVAAADVQQLREAYVAAMQARGEEDFAAYLEKVDLALTHDPSHPILHQHRARAAALTGASDEAFASIERALGLGAAFDVAGDPWLEALHGDARWASTVESAAKHREHLGEDRVGFELEDWNLLPEGIAHDPRDGSFYLSSIARRNLVRIHPDGRTEDFIPTEHGGFSLGLGIDVDAERDLLWACASADTAMHDFSDGLRDGVWAFDLGDGAVVEVWHAPADSVRHGFNDVEVCASGRAFATDAYGGNVYELLQGGDVRAVHAENELFGPNGIAHEGNLLFVAEYGVGVHVHDLATDEHWRLDTGPDVTLVGIDGLYFHEESLVAVQNAYGLDRIVKAKLSTDRRRVVAHEVLEARHPRMDDPTTGVIVDGELWYIANSHIVTYQQTRQWPEPEEFGTLLILRVKL